jgi:PPOX class probable F420-dependent enzyme
MDAIAKTDAPIATSPAREAVARETVAGARIRRFLGEEPIVWLSTVRPNGRPHLVPIWFWWDGEALLIFSKPNAQKIRNLRFCPDVMLALGDAEEDFDIGLLHGMAELLDMPTRDVVPAAHLAKYADRMAAIGLDAETYVATYSQVIRITPADYLGWHGRTVPQSARLAGALAITILEPRRDGPAGDGGEPIARRAPAPMPRVAWPVQRRRPGGGRLVDPLARRLRGLTGGLAPHPLRRAGSFA